MERYINLAYEKTHTSKIKNTVEIEGVKYSLPASTNVFFGTENIRGDRFKLNGEKPIAREIDGEIYFKTDASEIKFEIDYSNRLDLMEQITANAIMRLIIKNTTKFQVLAYRINSENKIFLSAKDISFSQLEQIEALANHLIMSNLVLTNSSNRVMIGNYGSIESVGPVCERLGELGVLKLTVSRERGEIVLNILSGLRAVTDYFEKSKIIENLKSILNVSQDELLKKVKELIFSKGFKIEEKTKKSQEVLDESSESEETFLDENTKSETKNSVSSDDTVSETKVSVSNEDAVSETKVSVSDEDAVSETKNSVSNEDAVSETKVSVSNEDAVSETKNSVSSDDTVSETKNSVSNEDAVSETKNSVSNEDAVSETKVSVSNEDAVSETKSSVLVEDAQSENTDKILREDEKTENTVENYSTDEGTTPTLSEKAMKFAELATDVDDLKFIYKVVRNESVQDTIKIARELTKLPNYVEILGFPLGEMANFYITRSKNLNLDLKEILNSMDSKIFFKSSGNMFEVEGTVSTQNLATIMETFLLSIKN